MTSGSFERLEHLRVLLIEDNPDDAALVQRYLTGDSVELHHVGDLEAGLEHLRTSRPDLVLLDLRLSDSDLSETLTTVLQVAGEVPVTLLTSIEDMRLAVDALQQGAQDYLVKSELTPDVLRRSLRYSVERKRAQARLHRYARELERSNQALQQFADVVGHDLKQPLNTLHLWCELLKRKIGDDAGEEVLMLLDETLAAARRMAQLVDGVLEYGRAAARPRTPVPVEAEAALRGALANLEAALSKNGAEVTHQELPTVVADSSQLVELFQNLVDNAVKYRSQEPPRIHVEARRDGSRWHFSVRDNGIGMDPAQCERVFVIFKRLHDDDSIPGLGLGLCLAKQIVEAHHGQIWVESQPGAGSCFHFTLPADEED